VRVVAVADRQVADRQRAEAGLVITVCEGAIAVGIDRERITTRPDQGQILDLVRTEHAEIDQAMGQRDSAAGQRGQVDDVAFGRAGEHAAQRSSAVVVEAVRDRQRVAARRRCGARRACGRGRTPGIKAQRIARIAEVGRGYRGGRRRCERRAGTGERDGEGGRALGAHAR